MTTESDRYVRRRRWDGTVAHMENARAKGGLTLGSSIFAVEVSVWWPYPGRGFSSPRHQGGGTCKPALAAGGEAGHRLTLVWPSGARRLEKKNRSQWLRTRSSWDRASTVVTCSGRIGTRWGRTVAGLVDGPPEWPKLCNARLRGVDDRRRVGRPWAMGHGRGRSDGTAP